MNLTIRFYNKDIESGTKTDLMVVKTATDKDWEFKLRGLIGFVKDEFIIISHWFEGEYLLEIQSDETSEVLQRIEIRPENRRFDAFELFAQILDWQHKKT